MIVDIKDLIIDLRKNIFLSTQLVLELCVSGLC